MGGNSLHFPPTPGHVADQVRLGVDLACTREEGRSPKDVTSQAKLDDWVDIFGEMFSETCRNDMKHASVPGTDNLTIFQKRLRRFYAYWGLKEAFIKMVGEGLLADWLQELEFENVRVPDPASPDDFPDDGFSWAFNDAEERKWTPPDRAVKDISATLYGHRVNDVQLDLVAYEQDFLVATAMRGVRDAAEGTNGGWINLDIEKDIRPCAESRCRCLIEKVGSRPTSSKSPLTIPGDERRDDAAQTNGKT